MLWVNKFHFHVIVLYQGNLLVFTQDRRKLAWHKRLMHCFVTPLIKIPPSPGVINIYWHCRIIPFQANCIDLKFIWVLHFHFLNEEGFAISEHSIFCPFQEAQKLPLLKYLFFNCKTLFFIHFCLANTFKCIIIYWQKS